MEHYIKFHPTDMEHPSNKLVYILDILVTSNWASLIHHEFKFDTYSTLSNIMFLISIPKQ